MSLLDLFEGRRQLIVYRAYLRRGGHRPTPRAARTRSGPAWAARWSPTTSPPTSVTCTRATRRSPTSRARRRPRSAGSRSAWDGQHIPWYTVTDDFDTDHDVREWHGHNAFIRDGEKIFRTYLINGRGDEGLGTNWSYLDITALGRQEAWEDSPDGYPQTPPYEWWNYHDAYGERDDRPRRRRAVRGAPAARVGERREHRAARGTRVGCSTEGQRVGVAPHTLALARPGR